MVRIRTAKGTLVMDWKIGYPVPLLSILNAEATVNFEASGTELDLILNALRGQDDRPFRQRIGIGWIGG